VTDNNRERRETVELNENTTTSAIRRTQRRILANINDRNETTTLLLQLPVVYSCKISAIYAAATYAPKGYDFAIKNQNTDVDLTARHTSILGCNTKRSDHICTTSPTPPVTRCITGAIAADSSFALSKLNYK